ncbi:MAG: divalent metal cation transporter [Verrucomicrobia bacterium]|nr:divalent metal cation transporter [Verrucomicrobiota bacterium]
MSTPRPAPVHWRDVFKHVGPGLILTASIVGSGELIVTPKLGASAGFTLLWFIILGCIVKVFVQVELGRFAVARGLTTIAAMNTIPGPRFIVSWLVWLWLGMFFALTFQVAGMLGGVAQIAAQSGFGGPGWLWATIAAGLTALLLFFGRYRLVENISTSMVVLFTLCTVVAVAALQWSDYRITAAHLREGFSFGFPKDFTTAFAAFAIIGVGASELIYYPYWCLEKGYAGAVGPRDGSDGWRARARGWVRVMKFDAWFSCIIYTTATVAFYLLGAAVLHAKGLVVENKDMIATLSHMYRESFGTWGLAIFLIGAFNVLYSTVFAATASNARLMADGLQMFRLVKYETPERGATAVKWCCVALPTGALVVFIIWGAPVALVLVGAVAQGVMLPFLALAALWFRSQEPDPALRSGPAWNVFLWIAALSMSAVGVHEAFAQISKLLK